MSAYALMDLDELNSLYSDYHKDMYGFRPRNCYSSTKEDIIRLLTEMDNAFNQRKETFAGREQLREEGWVISETDPELIQRALWLKQERDLVDERY